MTCLRFAGVLTVLLTCTLPVGAQTNGTPERFTAMAVNMTNRGFGSPYNVQLVIDRWATSQEFAAFTDTLAETGSPGVLKMLERRSRIGFLRTRSAIAFNLALALQAALPDGGRRIIVVSPRFVRPAEVKNAARILDYAFVIIDLKLAADGSGEGTMSSAAKISLGRDRKTIDVENFGVGSTVLKGVAAAKR